MNRAWRRANRVRDPKGNWLEPRLLLIEERGPDGRPTRCRIAYDDETIGQVVTGQTKAEFLLVWMGEGQGAKPS